MIHKEKSELAGKSIKIKADANGLGGMEILIEDWWDRIAGKSWMICSGNPACLNYALRTGTSKDLSIPNNNEVVYGKIGGLGYLVNIIELETETPVTHDTAR